MDYKINWGLCDGVFAVPDIVVDDFLKLASGKAVKVIMYIMRYKAVPTGADLGMSDEDIEDGLSYWEQVGILCRNGKDAPVFTAAASSAEKDNKSVAVKPVQTTQSLPSEPAETEKPKTRKPKPQKAMLPAEIAKRAEESEEIAFLFRSAEECLAKVLTFDDQRTLLWIHDHLNMSADIILMIAAYCVSVSKPSMANIEKMAVNWHDKDITTHEQADREILSMQKRFSLEKQISSKLELNRKLTTSEAGFASAWADKNIPIELIMLAYDKSIPKTGKLSFNYMNSILMDWYDHGVETPLQAEQYDEQTRPASKKTAAKKQQPKPVTAVSSDIPSQPSYDLGLIFERTKNTVPKLKNTQN